MRGRAAPLRLRHRVLASIRRHRLWEPSARVAVAVSGGLDSVVLLDLLLETRRQHGAELSVVTVDHGLRPEAADDARFVEALAAGRGLSCVRAELALGAASEAEARRARYEVLERLAVDRVALAHHRDDLAETVLLQLLRGTGTAGLAGMRWRRDRYVRPLLDTGRDALAAWAATRGLTWRDDATNLDPAFLRNRVRHEVMPLLEQLRPSAARALARSALVAAADAEYLDQLADLDPHTISTESWPTVWVATAPEAIVRRALLRRAPALGSRGLDDVIAAAARGSGRVAVPGGGLFVIDPTRVSLTRPDGQSR